MASSVRLTALTLENFKNVIYGKLTFPELENGGSVLGLYGQNGSGKSALIRALACLKTLFCGQALGKSLVECIRIDAGKAHITYDFCLENEDEKTPLSYEVFLQTPPEGLVNATSSALAGEKLSIALKDKDGKARKTLLIDTTTADYSFGPQSRFKDFVGSDKTRRMALNVARELTREKGTSFLFSPALTKALTDRIKEDTKTHPLVAEVLHTLERLISFGKTEFFVSDSSGQGHDPCTNCADSTAPETLTGGLLILPLTGPVKVVSEKLPALKRLIGQMNLVLKEIIPGLTIVAKRVCTELGPKGEDVTVLELSSLKNHDPIPLRYESEGIKKIISVLNLLICVYNEPSVTVAIDELDSGVFEYLLGELLRIISERGMGQLIFTSHNLRALETMDRACIAFTTADPKNAYVHIKKTQATTNLRDLYYRMLILGSSGTTPLYNPTSSARIALALREAGVNHD